MKSPDFLKENDIIGITALSSGAENSVLEMKEAINNLSNSSFIIKETNDVYGSSIVSASIDTRIKELNSLLLENIKLLLIARGGNFLYELLEYIPYEKIVAKNILVEGYSDSTSLLYILTTKYDLLTIYGFNGKTYSGKILYPYQLTNIEILKGNLVEQVSYDNDTKSINGEFSSDGILLGGCLEVLKDLIGTKYDYTKEFIEKHKNKKIIWYFDIYEMKPIDVYITLLQMKNALWFQNSDTFIIGKIFIKQKEALLTYQEAYMKALANNIIYDANIGHVKPMFTIINGIYANVVYKNNKLYLQMKK